MTVNLDTRLLRAFVAVAEELNFTRAAQRLYVAQQALSSQIQQLERRVGGKLFDRTTRRVELTEAGERLLPHARAVLEALDAATAELDALRRAGRVTLRRRHVRDRDGAAGGSDRAALRRAAPEVERPA